MLSLQNRITVNSVRRSISSAFSISHSFILDGVDEQFTTPNAGLSSDLSGLNKKFTISTIVKFNQIGINQTFFAGFDAGQESLQLRFDSLNRISVFLKDGDITKSAVTSSCFPNMSNVHLIEFSYDSSQSLGSRITIYFDGIEQPILSDTSTNNIDSTSTIYGIGAVANQLFLKANQSLFYVRNTCTTPAEALTGYNFGKPLSGKAQFGLSEIVTEFNPDESGNTAQFSVVDPDGLTFTSINMEDIDKTTTTPYT